MAERRAGILLHPTSLPGRWGIGDLGPEADRFLDWMEAAGQDLWQVLPLGPTALGNSPYATLSAFAGNPALVSPERLVEEGLLDAAEPSGSLEEKHALLRRSWERFREGKAPAAIAGEFEAFRFGPERAPWLPDWSLFAALKARHEGVSWLEWDAPLRLRDRGALARAESELADEVGYRAWLQFLFSRQWDRVREEAARRGIRILGDVPIYVALDSADLWARRDLFLLDEEGRPTAVAGVPPDYFSETGQLWGNPLYRWDRMADEGYAWWIERMRANAALADALRLDHFRGFAAYWEVPAAAETAAEGRWVDGPGKFLFDAIGKALPDLAIVAEDLGLITEDVRALRRACGFPGMRVLQFAFDGSGNEHLPHRHGTDCVVYTGTHDNDTTRGWFASLDRESKERVLLYTGADKAGVVEGLIRAAYVSPAAAAVVPVQDVLDLGSEARMNVPGKAEGNWGWRLSPGQLGENEAARLARLAEVAGRGAAKPRP